MARKHGSKGQVALIDSSPAVVLASLNRWTLDTARDRVDVTSFGDTNKVYVQGLPDIKGTLGGFYDPGEGSPLAGGNLEIFEISEGEEAVALRLMPTTAMPDLFWSGPAFLDASIDVSATGAITISGSFVAAGAWARA